MYYLVTNEILSQIKLIETKDAIVPIELDGVMYLCKSIIENYPHLADVFSRCKIVELGEENEII